MAAEGTLAKAWVAAARGDKNAPLAGKLLVAAMYPLSLLFVIGFRLYMWLEKAGFRKRTRLNAPVISVGNLTMGGTGKTSVVQQLAGSFSHDFHTAVLLRGYHSKNEQKCTVVSDGRGGPVLVPAEQAGDEAAMLASDNPSLIVVTGKDRRLSGDAAIRSLEAEIIILDDGLQYWQLHRDIDIVLVDAVNPFGNGLVMPAGILREPVDGLKRAAIAVVTHADEVDSSQLQAAISAVRQAAPGVEVYTASYIPTGIVTSTGQQADVQSLSDQPCIAACGLGSPDSFFRTVSSTGARLLECVTFSDHHHFSQQDVEMLHTLAADREARYVVVSLKDWAKIASLNVPEGFAALSARLQIDRYDQFLTQVQTLLEAHTS